MVLAWPTALDAYQNVMQARQAQHVLENLKSYCPDTTDPRILKLKALAPAQVGREEESEQLRQWLQKLVFNIGVF